MAVIEFPLLPLFGAGGRPVVGRLPGARAVGVPDPIFRWQEWSAHEGLCIDPPLCRTATNNAFSVEQAQPNWFPKATR